MSVFRVDSDPPFDMFTAPPLPWLLVHLQETSDINSFYDWLFVRGQRYFGKWVNENISRWSFNRFIRNWCKAARNVFWYLTTVHGQKVNIHWLALAETLTFVKYDVVQSA